MVQGQPRWRIGDQIAGGIAAGIDCRRRGTPFAFVRSMNGYSSIAKHEGDSHMKTAAIPTPTNHDVLPRDEHPARDGVAREELIRLLNEDLAREYQAIIAYVAYSQAIKGAPYMHIAKELEKHAGEELKHAMAIARQIDYLGGVPCVIPKPVTMSTKAEEMLRLDLDNEAQTIRHYRRRVRQCEAAGEYAMAERIREILMQEQDHLIELATALGEEVPDITENVGGA
jgi:bacterioferritin